ncbi:hypothetical protein [Donghicola mangrovi]|uniref:Uncharacterized protein n=1 Tax=Donghicola mangrovi TaxID=2729614 RepID=A0A850Q863_9RHOB|nr:hypothetical protein [Donghicola mangrovi]NVO22161.1 hypothetical protein [Donghicola mangrovi]
MSKLSEKIVEAGHWKNERLKIKNQLWFIPERYFGKPTTRLGRVFLWTYRLVFAWLMMKLFFMLSDEMQPYGGLRQVLEEYGLKFGRFRD